LDSDGAGELHCIFFLLSSDGRTGEYVLGGGANQNEMKAKKRAVTANAIEQAELILHLFELRRETVMREARSYVGGGEFMPASGRELVEIVTTGGRRGSFVLQVFGYWDMVAAFVQHGALDGGLVYDTCQEMYFQYAKIQPHLKEFRKAMNLPEWMISIERVVEGSKAGRARLAVMQKGLAGMAGGSEASGKSSGKASGKASGEKRRP
jgi:hypothetical protein